MRFYYRDNLLTPHSDRARQLYASWQLGKREICLSGGRGKGKTLAILLYLLRLTNRIPNLHVVIARSEYASIKESIIETLQGWIFKYPLGDSRNRHPKNPFVLVGGVDRPSALRFANGAQWRFIGLNDKTKRSGTECDIFWLNEGQREDTNEVWGAMGATLAGGRKGNWWVNGERFSQMIVDANPDAKFHWLYKNFHDEDDQPKNETELWLPFTHHDNPALVDEITGELNALGHKTQEDLLKFYPPGFRRQQMVWGDWCAAEGMVFTMWNPAVHEINMSISETFGVDTKWYMATDHGGGGKRSPFAVSLTGKTPDGKFNTFKEFGMTNCTIDKVIERADALLNRYSIPKSKIQSLHADTNVPGFNLAWRQAGYPIVEAEKDVLAHVDYMKMMIGDNRFFVNKNSLEWKDPHYEGPQGFKDEVLSYAYLPEEKQETAAKPSHPVKKFDHWIDERMYMLYGLREDKIQFPLGIQKLESFSPWGQS